MQKRIKCNKSIAFLTESVAVPFLVQLEGRGAGVGGHGKERQQDSEASVKKKMRRRRSKRRRGASFLPNKTKP